jgi:hypothetical protein
MTEEPRDFVEYKTDHDLLIRVDQRLDDLIRRFDKQAEQYVTQSEFWPVKMLVYGCAAMMLVAVVGALIYLVVIH